MNRTPLAKSGLALAAVLAAATVAGCSEPTWTTPVTGLGPVVLSVWGSSPTNVWAVGGTCDAAKGCPATSEGLILHFDGTTWTRLPAPKPVVYWWVFGLSPSDVWISGENDTILHWDGTALSVSHTGTDPTDKLFGIWGSSSTDIWAVGGRPDMTSTVLHYDGTTWGPAVGAPGLASNFFKVWGSGQGDVWIVGPKASLVHFDGHTWGPFIDVSGAGLAANEWLVTVAGRAANDVYAVGGSPSQGKAIHYNGMNWQPVAGLSLSATSLLTGVYESAAGDVAITGLSGAKFIGKGESWHDWSLQQPLVDLHAVWMAGPEDVFAVGGSYFTLTKGVVAHFGGAVPGTLK